MHLATYSVKIWHSLVVNCDVGLHVAISCCLVTEIELILQLSLNACQVCRDCWFLLSVARKDRGQPSEVLGYITCLGSSLHRQML